MSYNGKYKGAEIDSLLDKINSGSSAYPLVEHGTSDTTFALIPNTFHVWDEVASLDLSLSDETAGVANEYIFQFTSGATPTALTLPDNINWANDTELTIEENTIYQISILKGIAVVLKSAKPIFPITLVFNNTIDSNPVYASVYSELAKRGIPGSIEPGLLFVDYNSNIVEVTNYSFWNTSPYILLYSFGSPIYYDIVLLSDGILRAYYND